MIQRILILVVGALALVAMAGESEPDVPVPDGVRITFLTQDAQPGAWDHAGCCGQALAPLRDYVRDSFPKYFVKYDVGRLIRKNIPPYYIYNKKYCVPIGRELGANLFIMTSTILRNESDSIEQWRFDVEAKAYSVSSGGEVVFFRASDVSIDEVQAEVRSRRTELLSALLRATETDGSASQPNPTINGGKNK